MMEWELPYPDHEVVSCNGHGSVKISTRYVDSCMHTLLQWRSHSFKVSRAQSGLLTALIGCLMVLFKYFDF